MLIHDPLAYWAVQFPDSVCVCLEDGSSLTYANAQAAALRAAARLATLGLGLGDRVGLLSSSALTVPVALFGSSRAGCTVVPLNPRLASDELRYIIEDAKMKVVYAGAELTTAVDAVRDRIQVEHFVVLADEAPEGWVSWPDWLDSADEVTLPYLDVEDIAVQIYTSGTTGRPKGAMLSHRTISSVDHRWQIQGMRMSSGEVFYLPMPITLAAGFNCAVNAWMQGAAVRIAAFDAARVAVALDHGITATCMAPTMIKRVVETSEALGREYADLKWILYGGAPMSAPLLRQALNVFHCDFYQALGQTEAPCMSILTPEDHRRAVGGEDWLLGSVGRFQIGCEIELHDPATGDHVALGEVGEVWVRGSWVMNGYWGNEESVSRLAAGGWHYTGDLVRLNEEGYMFVVDRRNDTVVTGGYNVYPREVERVFEEHPDVGQVAVFGVPNDEWGQELVAALVAVPGVELEADTMIAYAKTMIAGYKVPRRFVMVDELPTNSNGKVLKTTLRRQWPAGTGK